ncbi:hypothetical protein F4780DRAFT_162040 [Xylariomycetidae sp. FL0641]|nr:hypothetical protein F4780DRAFT_162040 [Xylariomycetidae sp. FL0641]
MPPSTRDRDPFISTTHSGKAGVPSPLHIRKKAKKTEAVDQKARKTSDASLSSSLDRPLTVIKKRSKRNVMPRGKENIFSGIQPLTEIHRSSTPLEAGASKTGISPDSGAPWAAVTPRRAIDNRQPLGPKNSLRRRTLSPSKLPSGLRWLSSTKTPSTKALGRQQREQEGFAGLTNASSSESLYSQPRHRPWEYSKESSLGQIFNAADTGSFVPRIPSNSLASSTSTDGVEVDPYLLSPRISMTPERRTLGDGPSSVWVAIEVFGHLSRPSIEPVLDASPASDIGNQSMSVHHGGAGLSRYGYLYEVRVDVSPTAQSSIIDLIDDHTMRITPGSGLLILAHVRVEATTGLQPKAVPTPEPNDLIADLEYQLGNVTTDYLRVRVKYCHSGFPATKSTTQADGISTCQTRLETIATGAIRRSSSTSAWSPRPGPAASALLDIMASHWGPVRANEVFHKVITQKPSPRKRKSAGHVGLISSLYKDSAALPPPRTGTAPLVQVPQRRASLQRSSSPEEPGSDPARKIWTEMRRTSSGARPSFHVGKVNRSPAATTYAVSHQESRAELRDTKAKVERQRALIRDTALRNKRSIGADSLKSLVPSMEDMSIGEKDRSQGHISGNATKRPDTHFDGRKRDGRWSLGWWYQ